MGSEAGSSARWLATACLFSDMAFSFCLLVQGKRSSAGRLGLSGCWMNILDVILLSQRLDALPVGRSCRSGRIARIRHGFAEFLEVSFHGRRSEYRQQPTGRLPHVLVGMGHPAGDMHHAARSRSDGLYLSIAQGRKLELAR